MALSRSRFLAGLAAGAAALAMPPAFAQNYPDHPVKFVVPYAPGGATDILARLLATTMGQKLGQPMVVDNRPGANTVLAAGQVAKAPPDGYTLLLGASPTLVMNQVVRKSLPYDPQRGFTMLGLVADMGLVLVANPSVPANTLQELIALTKAAPDKFAYGSFGSASTVHLAGEMLKTTTGMQMLHVPFNGSSPSLTRRLALLPQVPTVAESGYPGFDVSTWFAFLAPAGLPAPVQKKLEQALADAMAMPETRRKLVDIGLTPAWGPGSALRERMERELPQIRAVAARANIQAE